MSFWEDYKDIREVRKHAAKKESLLLDYYAVDPVFHHTTMNLYDIQKRWTDEKEDRIFFDGYYETEKWMTELRYLGVKVYVKFHNFKVADAPNKMTSAALYDFCNSDATKNFISGMTKVNIAPMDMKTIGILIPIGIGILIGVLYFMTGGFH